MRKTSVYLTDALKEALADAASRSGRSEADFIRGAIERRDARKKLFVDAARDETARTLLEKRFWTRMGGSMSSLRTRVVV